MGGNTEPFTGPAPTMEQLYYDREGCPVNRTQWQQLGCLPGYSRIARTDIIRYGRRINVATRWIGIADGTAVARIFQTDGEVRRRGAPRPSYRRQWEWATLEAARTGHQEIADWLTRVATWLAGVTDQMPSPPHVPSALTTPNACRDFISRYDAYRIRA